MYVLLILLTCSVFVCSVPVEQINNQIGFGSSAENQVKPIDFILEDALELLMNIENEMNDFAKKMQEKSILDKKFDKLIITTKKKANTRNKMCTDSAAKISMDLVKAVESIDFVKNKIENEEYILELTEIESNLNEAKRSIDGIKNVIRKHCKTSYDLIKTVNKHQKDDVKDTDDEDDDVVDDINDENEQHEVHAVNEEQFQETVEDIPDEDEEFGSDFEDEEAEFDEDFEDVEAYYDEDEWEEVPEDELQVPSETEDEKIERQVDEKEKIVSELEDIILDQTYWYKTLESIVGLNDLLMEMRGLERES